MKTINKWTSVWKKGSVLSSLPEIYKDLEEITRLLKKYSEHKEFIIYSTYELRMRITSILDKSGNNYIDITDPETKLLVDYGFSVNGLNFYVIPRFIFRSSLIIPFSAEDLDPKKGMIIDQ